MSRPGPKEISALLKQALEDELAVEELVGSIDDIPDEMLTPYNRACRQGDYNTYNRLPEPDERDAKQGPALYFALQGGEHRIIYDFIGDGIDDRLLRGQTPLMVAAALGRHEAVQAFLINDAEPDLVDGNGESAVHKTARTGNVAALDLLLHYGASPDLVDPKGRTLSPLVLAIEGGHSRCVTRLLLEDQPWGRRGDLDLAGLHAAREADREILRDVRCAMANGVQRDMYRVVLEERANTLRQ